jgi:hypothetical protein
MSEKIDRFGALSLEREMLRVRLAQLEREWIALANDPEIRALLPQPAIGEKEKDNAPVGDA